MKFARTTLSLAMIVLTLSCSSPKHIDVDDLRSEFTEATSLCSETETFIDFVDQGRSTQAYARGHLEFLSDSVQRQIDDLRSAQAEMALQPSLQLCINKLEELALQLAAIRANLQQTDSLASVKGHVLRIRRELQKASPSPSSSSQ